MSEEIELEPPRKTVMDSELLDSLRLFLREQSVLADKCSHEWDPAQTGRNPQACYRAGMWWAFHQAEIFLGSSL